MMLHARCGGCEPEAPKYYDFIADHPFLFALKSQDEVYFMGRFVGV